MRLTAYDYSLKVTTHREVEQWVLRWKIAPGGSQAPAVDPPPSAATDVDKDSGTIETDKLPLRNGVWQDSDLAKRLASVYDEWFRESKPPVRPPVLLVDDRQFGPDDGPRPVVRWHRVLIALSNADTRPLGELMTVVCRASDAASATPRFALPMSFCALLPGFDFGNRCPSRDEVRDACAPSTASGLHSFERECGAILDLLDNELFPYADMRVAAQDLVGRACTVETCNDWETIRNRMNASTHSLLAWIGVMEGDLLHINAHHELGASTPSAVSADSMHAWLTLAVGGGAPAGHVDWLGWPYTDRGPSAFVSTDSGLASDECCLLTGAFVRLLWLKPLPFCAAAACLHGHLAGSSLSQLPSCLQLAARNPCGVAFPWTRRPSSTSDIVALAEFLSFDKGKGGQHRFEIQDAYFRATNVVLEFDGSLWSKNTWTERLNRRAEQGTLAGFITHLWWQLPASRGLISKLSRNW